MDEKDKAGSRVIEGSVTVIAITGGFAGGILRKAGEEFVYSAPTGVIPPFLEIVREKKEK